MIESQPKALEKAKPDFTEPKEIFHKDHVGRLQKAQAYVAEMSRKRTAVEIKIPGGVIVTTRPERWEEHNEVTLRGNAAMNQKNKEE